MRKRVFKNLKIPDITVLCRKINCLRVSSCWTYLFCNFAIYWANYSEKHQSKSEIFLLWYWPYCWCNPLFGFFLFHGLGRHIMQSLEDFQVVPHRGHRGHLCCRGCHANRKESWVETSLRFFQRLFLLLRFGKNRPRRNCKVWKCEALDFFPRGFSS